MDPLTEFAKMLKDRENPSYLSISTGIVVKLPPDPVIKFTNEINFYARYLIFAEHVSNGLKIGDEVIIIPTVDLKKCYVVGKAVRYNAT